MTYNFARLIERRGTDSVKWDNMKERFGRDDLLPMWVADSDWPAPPAVIQAIKERAEQGALGYTSPGEETNHIVVDWVKRRYDWDISPEWLVYSSGVVPALNAAVRANTRPGDEVIIQPPVYYPFYSAVSNNGARLVHNNLLLEQGRYRINYSSLEESFKDDQLYAKTSRAKMMILCNPHNPVGRVWSREELIKVGEICLAHNAVVVSDEIHADLIYPGHSHIPFAAISEEFALNSVTMIAPSKTFNLAGLHTSVVIIPNPQLRSLFMEAKKGWIGEGSLFGFTALKTAYSKCDDWLEEQLEYIQGNLAYALEYTAEYLPQVRIIEPEGTYLLWMDFNRLGLTPRQLNDLMVNRARVALDAGTWFGPGGEGFMRLNLACPRSLLKEGLERVKKAVNQL